MAQCLSRDGAHAPVAACLGRGQGVARAAHPTYLISSHQLTDRACIAIKAVEVDFRCVLIDWSPEYLYRQLIPGETERRWFLTHVCSMDWVIRQDGGQPIVEATDELIAKFPDHAPLIRAFYERWHEMVAGVLEEGVAIMEKL